MNPASGNSPGRGISTRLWVLIVVVLLLVTGLSGLAWVWHQWNTPLIPPTTSRGDDVEIRIPTGATLSAVIDSLAQHDLLRQRRIFRFVARLTGDDRRIQAGLYSLPPGVAPRELLNRLVSGQTIPVRITLPEGISAEEAASLVSDQLGVDAQVFLSVADSLTRQEVLARNLMSTPWRAADFDSLIQHQPADAIRSLHWSEGYLAPDTYYFAEGTSARLAAKIIVDMGLARLDSVYGTINQRVRSLDLSPHELLTLGSIVEAEAQLDTERTRVAAVYVNRLHSGWRLEADPCVAYLLDKKGERLLYKDLAVPSPYNTYRNSGLPPGPIGSPGLASLRAAATPADDDQIMFFVADGEGGHVFSRTRQQHEEAVQIYRQKRRRDSR